MAGTLSNNSMTYRLLLALVLLSPLPLGSNRPWAWSLFAVLLGMLLVVWCVLVLTGRAQAPIPLPRLSMVMLPFGAVVAWAFVQTVSSVPGTWAHPLWGEAAQALGEPVAASISVDPEMTRSAVLRLASYGGVFWLAAQLGRDRYRAKLALVTVAIAGTAYAIYGLVDHFAGWERIGWLDKWAYRGDLTSTFVNRNAYGAYAGLGLLCCIGLFLHALRPASRGVPRGAYDLAETVLVRAMPFLVGAVIIGTALLLSHSRGAFLCTGLALLALMTAAVTTRMTRHYMALAIVGIIFSIGLGILGLSGEVTVERLASTPAQAADDARNDLYRLTIDAIADAPLTGHGFGAFLPAFRMYRDTSLSTPVIWDYAHDVHLEIAMDLGLPAAVLWYLSLGAIVVNCLRGLKRRRRDHIYPAVALSAALLIGAHGIVDFSAQMPAIAVTLALLLGVGFAQSWSSTDNGASRSAANRQQTLPVGALDTNPL